MDLVDPCVDNLKVEIFFHLLGPVLGLKLETPQVSRAHERFVVRYSTGWPASRLGLGFPPREHRSVQQSQRSPLWVMKTLATGARVS